MYIVHSASCIMIGTGQRETSRQRGEAEQHHCEPYGRTRRSNLIRCAAEYSSKKRGEIV